MDGPANHLSDAMYDINTTESLIDRYCRGMEWYCKIVSSLLVDTSQVHNASLKDAFNMTLNTGKSLAEIIYSRSITEAIYGKSVTKVIYICALFLI